MPKQKFWICEHNDAKVDKSRRLEGAQNNSEYMQYCRRVKGFRIPIVLILLMLVL